MRGLHLGADPADRGCGVRGKQGEGMSKSYRVAPWTVRRAKFTRGSENRIC